MGALERLTGGKSDKREEEAPSSTGVGALGRLLGSDQSIAQTTEPPKVENETEIQRAANRARRTTMDPRQYIDDAEKNSRETIQSPEVREEIEKRGFWRTLWDDYTKAQADPAGLAPVMQDVMDPNSELNKDFAAEVEAVGSVMKHTDLGVDQGKIYADIRDGVATDEQRSRLKEIEQEMETLEGDVRSAPLVSKGVGMMAPYYWEGMQASGSGALKGALVFGIGTAALIGLEPTPIGEATSPITIPVAAGAGAKLGAAVFGYKNMDRIAGGQAYKEFMDLGMEPDKAADASRIVGAGTGVLEMLQLKVAALTKIPGLKGRINGVFAKNLSKLLGNSKAARAAAKYGSGTTKEASIEGLQELFANAVELTAAEIRTEYDEKDLTANDLGEIKDRLTEGVVDAFVITIVGGGVIGAPGAAVDVSLGGVNTELDATRTDGVNLHVPDAGADMPAISEATNKLRDTAAPSVKSLMGLEGDGVSVSGSLNMHDEDAVGQLNTNEAVSNVVREMVTDNGLRQTELLINARETDIENLQGLLDDQVMDGDHEAALSTAQAIQQKTRESNELYLQLVETAATKAEMNDSALDADLLTPIEAKVQQSEADAATAVEQQKNAVRKQQAVKNQAIIDNMNTEEGLKQELIDINVEESRGTGKVTKTFNNVVAEINLLKRLGDEAYFEQVSVKALDKLRGEVHTQRLIDQRNMKKGAIDPVTGAQGLVFGEGSADTRKMAVSDATLRYLDELLLEKSEYDLNAARQARAEDMFKRTQEDARLATRKESIDERSAKAQDSAKVVSAKQDKLTAERAEKEQANIAAKAKVVEKRKSRLSEQKPKIRKTPATAVSEDRKAELERSQQRQRDLKAQKKANVDLDAPKKPLSKPKDVKRALPNKVKLDAMGEAGTTTPAGQASVSVTDKKSLAHRDTYNVDLNKGDIKEQIREKKSNNITPEKLRDRRDAEYVILTSDNPQSTTRSAAKNKAGQQALANKLKSLGIPFKVGKSVFEGASETPFVITDMSRADAIKLSNELDQTSLIFAGKDDKVDLIDGDTVYPGKKSSIKFDDNLTDNYTELDGKKFTIDFDWEAGTTLKVQEMQVPKDYRAKAASTFRSAAVQLPDGTVHEGTSHMDIIDNAIGIEAMIKMPMSEANKMKDGFVTHAGEFVERGAAAKLVGAPSTDTLYSEDFLHKVADAKHDDVQNMGVPFYKELPLGEKMGTLEIMEEMQDRMKTDPDFKPLFDRTKAAGTKTIFVTEEGQFGKLEEVKRTFTNMKAKDQAVTRFEGAMRMNPATGNMEKTGGNLGLYIPEQNTVVINLPAIGRRRDSIDTAFDTIVHEHVHARARESIKQMPSEEKAQLDAELTVWKESIGDTKFWNSVADNPALHPIIRMGAQQINGPGGLGEIISYSMANPEFAAWLNEMPASPRFKAKSSKIKTMWDALKDVIVKKVLKVPSKLDEVTEILNKHLKDNDRVFRFSKELGDMSFDFGDNVTTTKVEDWANELDTLAVNALPTTVVADSVEAAKDLGYQLADNVSGYWLPHESDPKKGTVVIIADKITSQEHFVSRWMHEQVAHQGLRNVFGGNEAALNNFLDEASALFKTREAKAFFQLTEDYDIGKIKNGVRVLNKADKRLAAEEFIARKAHSLKPKTKRGLIAKMRDLLKRWLPKDFVLTKGIKKGLLLTDTDIMLMLEAAKENVMLGDTKLGDMLRKAIDARRPKHKFKPWSKVPNFIMSDKEYIDLMKKVLKEAPNMRTWYTEHTEILKKAFGKDYDLITLLLGVTSPQAPVETNVAFAIESYAYMMGLTDKPGAMYPGALKTRMDRAWHSPETMLKDLESKQFKVPEFVRALLGDENATVGDVWMYRLFYGDPLSFGKDIEKYSIPQITGMRQKVHSLAAQMTEETGEVWTARETQAALWVGINAAQTGTAIKDIATFETGLNKKQDRFDGKSPLQWLRDMVPNLTDGPLSESLGMHTLELSPVSALQKKVLQNKLKDSKAKYPVRKDGHIKLLSPDMEHASTVQMANTIEAGGRTLTAPNQQLADHYKKVFGFEVVDGLDMKLSDKAVELFKNKAGNVKATVVIDNLGGYTGHYNKRARFAREAKESLTQIADMADKSNVNTADMEFIRTGNDGKSVLGKIHEWRDQSAFNIDRLGGQLEQEFLEEFGGRKSRMIVSGSGRKLNTAHTELLLKAMNLFIDSGDKTAKINAYLKKLAAKGKDLTNYEKDQIDIIERMINMTPEEKAWANSRIRDYYQEFFEFAQEQGIIDSQVDNYVKRTWKLPKELEDAGITWSGSGTTGFKLTPSSGKPRTLDSIIDGWEMGLKLQTDSAIANITSYGKELGYVFSNRRFIEYMSDMIDFDHDGLMFEAKADQAVTDKRYKEIHVRGMALPGHKVYALSTLADEINKMKEDGPNAIWDHPVTKFIRRINSSIKSTILSISLFHHLAGMRSWAFGVSGISPIYRLRPFKAYREGLRKINEKTGFEQDTYKHLGPVVDLLVREGLTIGQMQDFDELGIQESFFEDVLENRTGKVSRATLNLWRAARRKKRSLTTGLFNRLFAGLKAEAGAMELIHKIKQIEKKNKRAASDAEIKAAAMQVAELINADFGGLNLGRLKRNRSVQKAMQLALLAPDWTESNWRTVLGAMPGSKKIKDKFSPDPFNQRPDDMHKVYRKFWRGILIRTVLSTALAQAAVMAMFGDEEDREEYWDHMAGQFQSLESFGKGKWTGVDITPLTRKLGMGNPTKRQTVSIVGHFKDILKITAPDDLIKHKISPLARTGETLFTGTDWKGDSFTPLSELIGSGKLVSDRKNQSHNNFFSTLPSAIGYNLRQSLPIFGSELLQAYQGESSWFSSVARMGGLEVRDVRPSDVNEGMYWDMAQDVRELEENLDNAKRLRDSKAITEARIDIKRYEGGQFNKIKSRLGFARTRLGTVNDRIKTLQLKVDEGVATDSDITRLNELLDRKRKIYADFAKVIER